MEDVYVNVDYVKPVKDSRVSQDQSGLRSSERFNVAVVLCLGLLSVFLLAGLIGLGVHYHHTVHAELSTVKTNLTELLQASDNKLSNLIEERDLLKVNHTEMIEEWKRLQCLCRQDKTCPAGWIMFCCSCYFLSTETGNWTKGREDCKQRGADLVVIDGAEEQTFLSKIEEQSWSWIGLTEVENTWKWIDGTPLTLSYWEENQPDNGGGDGQWGKEDCAHIRTGKKTEENWNDRSCDASLRWLCEKKA